MNALMTQNQANTHPALAGRVSNEVRALTSREVDEVAGGGSFLFAVGGILVIGTICLDFGEELTEASEKLAEWIRG